MAADPFKGWGGVPLAPMLTADLVARVIQAGDISRIQAVGMWQCVEPTCGDYAHYLEGEFEFLFDHETGQVHHVTRRACRFCDRPQIFLSVYAELSYLAEKGAVDFWNGKLLQMWKQAALAGREYRRVEEV